MNTNTYYLVSLGCAKNTVDSESMAQLLKRSGYTPVSQADEAEMIIVNTCGFIAPARAESYQVLAELAASKRPGQYLIAAGCLTQRFGVEVARQVSGVDGILGTRRWMDIVAVVKRLRASPYPQPLYHLPQTETIGADEDDVARSAIQGVSAYLKIADGCRRPCAFCAIPLIKGPPVSRPMEAVLADARRLAEAGVREIVLLAQDTTDYGHDLGIKDGLPKLLRRLVATIPQVDWIRILYAYPGYVTDDLIETMATYPQILHYLDMPLQHAHPDTLRRMGRPANMDWVYRTLEKMRAVMPDLVLRTTFIVGYPGETEAEFETLLDFVDQVRFDKVGAFQFSFEVGTPSQELGDPIPPEVKQERLERLMLLQQGISLEKNQSMVGKRLDVLIEGQGKVKIEEEGTSEVVMESGKESVSEQDATILIGRSYRDAPEIDGLVLIEDNVPQDDSFSPMVRVQITGAMTYDLVGKLLLD